MSYQQTKTSSAEEMTQLQFWTQHSKVASYQSFFLAHPRLVMKKPKSNIGNQTQYDNKAVINCNRLHTLPPVLPHGQLLPAFTAGLVGPNCKK